MKNIQNIEALLFVSGNEGLSDKEISKLLELDINTTRELITAFKTKLEREDSALVLSVFGEKYKLITKPEFNTLLSKFIDNKPNTFTQSSLETLAIIAYKAPITRIEVEDIRGVDCNFTISKLVAANLIEEVGRAQTPGLPILYNVTNEFMDVFKISDISQLPSLDELKNKHLDGKNIFETKYTDGEQNEQNT